MRKSFLLLLCLFLLSAAPALAQDTLPEGVLSALSPDLALLSNGSIESFCFPNERECIVLLRDAQDDLSLYSLQLAEGQWTRSWVNRYLSVNTASPAMLCAHEEGFITRRTHTAHPTGFALTVMDETSVAPVRTFDFVFIDGRWRLVQYTGSDGVYLEIVHQTNGNCSPEPDDGDTCAVFWADERWMDITGKIVLSGCDSYCADNMAVSVLPGIYDGTYFFDLTPRFSTPQTELISVCLGVNGLKYPVYTGPGTNYHRAANGKASVSSSESFGVLGKTGDWLMVIYGISDGRARVGYVRYPGDPSLESIAELTREPQFTQIKNVFTIRKIPLWDDPVNRTNPLCTLPQNTEVVYLENCGDLAYVEVRMKDRWMRGYVENDCLGNG